MLSHDGEAGMTIQNFIPQPYPLFAVIVERAENPLRFEPAFDPIRLVLGWSLGDLGRPLPVLAGTPQPQVWIELVIYQETRERAEATVNEFAKAARSETRNHDLAAARTAVRRQAGSWLLKLSPQQDAGPRPLGTGRFILRPEQRRRPALTASWMCRPRRQGADGHGDGAGFAVAVDPSRQRVVSALTRTASSAVQALVVDDP
jgi:hypothetical protein